MFLFEQFYEQQITQPIKQVSNQAYTNKNLQQSQEFSDEEDDINSEDDMDLESDDTAAENENEEDQSVLPPDLAPLKRYYLITRLKELNNKLEDYNIKNNDLDIIVKFSNNLSYNSLLLLSTNIIQSIEDEIARFTNGKK